MRCPTCGAEQGRKQNFCRVCGHSIDGPVTVSATRSPSLGSLVMIGFSVMMLGGVIGVVGKMLIQNQIVTAAGVLVALLGMMLTVLGTFKPRTRRSIDDSHIASPVRVAGAVTNKLPDIRYDEIGTSVTEHTTELLSKEK